MVTIFLFIFGLVVGSFLAAFTFRYPRGISISQGRSRCDNCNKLIQWRDNIPILSYILLSGKCRHCKKKISTRYPVIEIATASIVVLVFSAYQQCAYSLAASPICAPSMLGKLNIAITLTISLILIAIFAIDIEHHLIPDLLVFILFIFCFLVIYFSKQETLSYNLLMGFCSADFFLFLHLITNGRGMGLGDVKLSFVLGFVLGWPLLFWWIFSAFLTGAVTGIILIAAKKASFGKKIAFGPFLIFSFFVILLFGSFLQNFPLF